MKKFSVMGIALITGLIVGSIALNNTKAEETPENITETVENSPKEEVKADPKKATDVTKKDGRPVAPKDQAKPNRPHTPHVSRKTPVNSSEPQPEQVTITSYRQIPSGENTDCEYTYSDGTTYRFTWKWVENKQSKITYTSGKCDPSVVGTPK